MAVSLKHAKLEEVTVSCASRDGDQLRISQFDEKSCLFAIDKKSEGSTNYCEMSKADAIQVITILRNWINEV